jgi:hypothetical protein
MLSKALVWASVSIGAPLLGNMEGCSFLRAFEIKRYIEICKNALEVGISLHWGTWRGFTCWDFFRGKESISGLLNWTQRTLRY